MNNLQRRTRIARSKPLARGASLLVRTALARASRLATRGARAARELSALRAFQVAVHSRISCERCGSRGAHAHHMARNPKIHDPALGALLCQPCHRAIHDHSADDWREWFRGHK